MRMIRLCGVLVLIMVLGSIVIASQAQGLLVYGSGQTSSISATAPVAVYTFQGEADDFVTIQVLSFSPDLQTTISVNNAATNEQVATSSSDAIDIATGVSRVSARLPETGVYIILVSGNGGTGDFAIRLDGTPTQAETEVNEGASVSNVASAGSSFLVYNIQANETTPLLATLFADAEGTTFSVRVLSPSGSQIGLLSGSNVQNALITLPPGTGVFSLEVTVNSSTEATITLGVALIGAPTPQPVDTAPTDAAPTDAAPTAEPTATVVTQATATVVQPTLAPTATTAQQGNPPTATATATMQAVQATATFTPSYTPTMQATATYTPSYTPTTQPAPQLAPADARFNNPLVIPLDNTVSVLDFVSYPDGDSEDRVAFEVSGMNNNSALSGGRARLVISVSCFGENTDQVEIFTGGRTYACGDTIVDREVTADSDTGSLIITAIGGEGTYVQWVLTGTATRVN